MLEGEGLMIRTAASQQGATKITTWHGIEICSGNKSDNRKSFVSEFLVVMKTRGEGAKTRSLICDETVMKPDKIELWRWRTLLI